MSWRPILQFGYEFVLILGPDFWTIAYPAFKAWPFCSYIVY